MATTIIINVCGKIFKTDLETICKSNLFKNMIDDMGVPTEEIFINRSPKLFEHVLAYIIDENYPFPFKYRSELDYFLIDYDPDELYNPDTEIKMIKSSIKNLEKKIDDKDLHFCEYESIECVNCTERAIISLRCKHHMNNPECAVGYCGIECNCDEKFCYEHFDNDTCAVWLCTNHCPPDRKYCNEHRINH